METLEKLRSQMESVERLRDIVKSMKALSAANIRQYQQSVAALTGYYRTVERGLHVVLHAEDGYVESPVVDAPKRAAAIVFGTDYGLCGRFNDEITTFALARLAAQGVHVSDRRVLALGGRVASSLEQAGQPVADVWLLPGSAAQISVTVQALIMQIDAWQEQEGMPAVYLFYNRQLREQQNRPVGIKVWPVELSRFRRLEEMRWPSRSQPIYTMPRAQLLAQLLRQYLFVTLFRACAESQASEHSNRLTSMQVAERNLDDNLRDLTDQFRRTRQESITSELLDLISGYESMRRT